MPEQPRPRPDVSKSFVSCIGQKGNKCRFVLLPDTDGSFKGYLSAAKVSFAVAGGRTTGSERNYSAGILLILEWT